MIKIVTLFSVYGLCLGNRLLLQANQPFNPQANAAGQQIGNFGQLCTSPDPTTAVCPSSSSIASDPSVLKCERPNECCLCRSISCGTDTTPCELFSVGENAAFGVKSINVIGDRSINNIIDCKGDQSCMSTVIRGKHVKSVQCSGRHSCKNAIILIDEPTEGFELKCGVTGACDGLQIALNIPAPPMGFTCHSTMDFLFESIECIGVQACKNLQFVVNNDGCQRIFVETIECRDGSCQGARFAFNGPIHIDQCLLSANGIQPTGLDQCFTGLRSLKCVECANQMRNLMDPMNGFQLGCDNERSCANSMFNIYISNVQRNEAFISITVVCNGMNSCDNGNFIFDNRNEKEVQINIRCMNVGACNNAKFISGVNSVIGSVFCENPAFCQGGMVNSVTMV